MKQTGTLRILPTGDPKTLFHRSTAAEILTRCGPPRYLLSQSAKAQKCEQVGVLNRVLYLTPGVFCPAATDACRAACLGHTSGNMQLSGSTLARDQRAAWYHEEPEHFLQELRRELTRLRHSAKRQSLVPAVRLNGTSDLPLERLHPEIFLDFPDIEFFDYTKIRPRIRSFLSRTLDGAKWPENYQLTFSGDGNRPQDIHEVLARRGNVALVFWPDVPKSWRQFPVIDGDQHDARFLDPRGVIVGLRAKGFARVELDGFIVRVCVECQEATSEMKLVAVQEDTHRHTLHRCSHCGAELRSRWILPHALKRRETDRSAVAA